ncbi:sulfatase-like hydrolase/transferase [Algisphaera agarilytica]|uniref:Arylsulfatase A-like enzyme n=1 Tax=Algisphaera agarilytica TaxID=1385975 RepID=A0A7X0LKG9_9BACT|nr:sulfatase-like hydrolase/transferase [Algisphaera agarilytica]MBB6429839.1 arylsulfatase A-like enzyme [Algisphaera agarilytica]
MKWLLSVVALVACLLLTPAVHAGEKAKPNIVLIFTDDISARELPIYGSSKWSLPKTGKDTSDTQFRADTPVLDRMANEGLWATNAWSNTVCSPTRAMMMTGRYASIHKWWNNGDLGKSPDGNWVWPLYESSPWQLGHAARDAGYVSIWAGKTQMKQVDHRKFAFDEGVFTPGSYLYPDNPHTDFKLVKKKGGDKKDQINLDTGKTVQSYSQPSWYWKPSVALLNHPSAPEPGGEKEQITWWPHTPEAQAEYGLHTYGPDVELDFIFDFMDRAVADDKPFFVYHCSHLGHDGFDFLHPEAGNKLPGTPVIEWDGSAYTRTEPKITGDNGVYDTHGTVTGPGMYSHVEYLDYQTWLYLQKLEELGQLDNTLVIFTSDNGTWGYGKHSHDRQKGTHVPFIVYAPGLGLTKQGKQDVLLTLADMLPTLAEVMGVEPPEGYELHGESFWSFLTTDQADHRDWVYSYKGALQLIRGKHVLKDGYDKWWDVSEIPDDLISFPQIKDWSKVSDAHRAERDLFVNDIMPRYDNHATERDAPRNP